MIEQEVVIVEDEADIGELIRFHVEREGVVTEVIQSGQLAMEAITRRRPTLVILDLMLPDLDGLEICRRMKWNEDTREIPILIVSAKGEDSDIVTGLELGADDYVTKPFRPKVLMARVRNLLRRAASSEVKPSPRRRMSIAGGALVIDLDRRQVMVHDQEVSLTRTEFDILHCLVSHPGYVRTRDQIISVVHGESVILTRRTVDVHITAIRRKLATLGTIIRTVRGVGYRIDEARAVAESDKPAHS